jgi:hypothetical protein
MPGLKWLVLIVHIRRENTMKTNIFLASWRKNFIEIYCNSIFPKQSSRDSNRERMCPPILHIHEKMHYGESVFVQH